MVLLLPVPLSAPHNLSTTTMPYKYTLTENDRTHIEAVRKEVEYIMLMSYCSNIKAPVLPPGNEPKCACNDRELYAITSTFMGNLDEIIALAIARHGMPSWRGEKHMQPTFDDLPVL